MPVICIGPVCVPLNLFIPFVVGVLHRYGYLKWFKVEWVTLRWWGKQLQRCRQWWLREGSGGEQADQKAIQQEVDQAEQAADAAMASDKKVQLKPADSQAGALPQNKHPEQATSVRQRGVPSSEQQGSADTPKDR